MDRYLHRQLGRRHVLRTAAAGAGAIGLGLSGVGRGTALVRAQESTPAASTFDPEACYQPFGDVPIVQYEKVADPPYRLALSNS